MLFEKEIGGVGKVPLDLSWIGFRKVLRQLIEYCLAASAWRGGSDEPYSLCNNL